MSQRGEGILTSKGGKQVNDRINSDILSLSLCLLSLSPVTNGSQFSFYSHSHFKSRFFISGSIPSFPLKNINIKKKIPHNSHAKWNHTLKREREPVWTRMLLFLRGNAPFVPRQIVANVLLRLHRQLILFSGRQFAAPHTQAFRIIMSQRGLISTLGSQRVFLPLFPPFVRSIKMIYLPSPGAVHI